MGPVPRVNVLGGSRPRLNVLRVNVLRVNVLRVGPAPRVNVLGGSRTEGECSGWVPSEAERSEGERSEGERSEGGSRPEGERSGCGCMGPVPRVNVLGVGAWVPSRG